MGSQRWLTIGFVSIGALVAVAAYTLGLSQGAAQAAAAAGSTYVDGWGWHRHYWGFGFPFGFFFLFWFVLIMLRGAFWGGPWHYRRRRWHDDWYDDGRAFDEWHRRSHERMQSDQTPRA